jgi:hypothetical protein
MSKGDPVRRIFLLQHPIHRAADLQKKQQGEHLAE